MIQPQRHFGVTTVAMNQADPSKPKIFLIGFNKCGTTSFHDFFLANGIPSVHWRANTLAMTIHRNVQDGHWPLLDGLEQWTAYTDMICIPGSPWGRSNSDKQPVIEACRYFRELHQCYPDSLFILNSRNPSDWVQSRLRHDEGMFARAYLAALGESGIQDEAAMTQRWLDDWHVHHSGAIDYFNENAPEQFLYFHLTSTPKNVLNAFLSRHFTISSPYLPHHHRST